MYAYFVMGETRRYEFHENLNWKGGGSNHAQGRWVLVEKNTVAFSVDFEGADVVSIGI